MGARSVAKEDDRLRPGDLHASHETPKGDVIAGGQMESSDASHDTDPGLELAGSI